MNDEQTTPEDAQVNEDTTSPTETNTDGGADDNYYSVDDPKKPVSTTIGDGEMHNEGLVGDGSATADDDFADGSTNEQDEAENHDSEG